MGYKSIWTIEKIKEGFERFEKENGRLPRALEVDSISYLPSARQIQRAFGGLVELRKLIGYEDNNFSAGKHRSKIGLESNAAVKMERKY